MAELVGAPVPVRNDRTIRIQDDGASRSKYFGASRSHNNGNGGPKSRAVSRVRIDGAVAEPTQNLLLAKLPPGELKAFTDQAEFVSLTTRDIVFEKGSPITEAYFPVTAMISLLTVLADGTCIEAMTVGHEGVAGLPLFHGVKSAQVQAICQIEGDAYRISAFDFLALLKDAPVLTAMLHRYSQFAQDSLAQSAACASIHLIEQRCARWLLLSSDTVHDRHFSLTQEFFAQMLAVRRSGVTTAMGTLERNNLVATTYGSITIIDREGLERISCECYQVVHDRRTELLT